MYDNIEVPENIDEFIKKGLAKGKRKKYVKWIKRASGILICVLVSVFITGIRVSPVFASNVAKIPGLNYIVEMVRFDKGLTAALDNEYIQHIGKSAESRNIVLTVKDIIADNSGMIIFYSLENKGDYINPQIRNVKLTDINGKVLNLSSSTGYAPYDGKIFEGKIEFYTNENQQVIPESVILNTQVEDVGNHAGENTEESNISDHDVPQTGRDNKILNDTWNIPITVDKSKLSGAEKVYTIDKTIEIEGQKITFNNIKIHPIKSILEISMDASNTKKIFAFEDIRLVDEKGEEWGRINNGFIGSNPGGDVQTLNFQSNYFKKPKELYITGNSIRALDKTKCYFTVDTEKNNILYSPDGLISLLDMKKEKDSLFINTEIKKDSKDIDNNYQISNEAYDSNGRKLEIIRQGMGSTAENCYETYDLKLYAGFKSPITFKICDYPSKIKGAFKVKIPLGGK